MPRFLRLSDFEWGSAGRYLKYVSDVLCLYEMDMALCYSFRIPKATPKRTVVDGLMALRARKAKWRDAVEDNNRKVSDWVKRREDDRDAVGAEEKGILRALYTQNLALIDLLGDHVDRCEKLATIHKATTEFDLTEMEDDEKDELPF